MKPHPPGAVASLVFGILAVVAWFIPFVGLLLALLALGSAWRARSCLGSLPDAYEPGGLHTAGLVTGLIGLVLAAMSTFWWLVMIGLLAAAAAAVSGQPLPASGMEKPLLW
jgi:hypothetical protein